MASAASAAPTAAFHMNMTKEQAQEIFNRYNQMVNEGRRQDDPDFIKLRNIMISIRQQSMANKQRQLFMQQRQQQQQLLAQQKNLAAQNGNGLMQQQTMHGNGVGNGATQSTMPALGDHQPSNPQPSVQSQTAASTAAQASKPQYFGTNLMDQDQVQMLKEQINAFKMLSRNMMLPQAMQQILFKSQRGKTLSLVDETPEHVQQPVERPPHPNDNHDGSTIPSAQEVPLINQKETFTDPWSLLAEQISWEDHQVRSRRPVVPSILPPGVDIERAREERENVIYNRILARKHELERLPANLAYWDTGKLGEPVADDTIKRKALLEYRMLCLLPKQRALRERLSREMIQSSNLAMTANRSAYRKLKRQSVKEARYTEKLEKQQRDARETEEKRKHREFLVQLVRHSDEVKKAAEATRKRIQRAGMEVARQHQNIEREEQKRVERTAKQRLQALKSNDEEAYLRLLGEAKDDRISHLLRQTDGFLKQLADSVKAQQRSAVARYGGDDLAMPESDEEEEEVQDNDNEDDKKSGKKVDYYEVAHRIKEEVTQQSSNLVGGTLKEYQLKGLQWMISLYNNNLNGILADEMGLGKTIQTISLITYLIEKKQQSGPFLVIVPLSTLTNWNNEFEKWAPTVDRIVYKGSPPARKAAQTRIRQGHFQVLLTTYEFIIKDRPVLSKIKWIHMIVDEGHRMKNANSKLSSTITQYYHTRYRLILTGTPLQNNLPELWALLNFVLPNIFKSVKSFDEWFNTPFANTGSQDKMELTEEEQLLVIRRLHKVLRPFLLRRLKKDVEKDLPDKQERVVKCNMSALQAKLYKQLVNHNKLLVSDGKGGKTGMRGLSNMLMQLRKLCNHPFVFEEVENQMNPSGLTNDLLWRTAGKFELLDRVLPKFQTTGHRVLMFFQMTQIMNIMEDFLRLRGISFLRLDGSTKADDRSELLKLFNEPGSKYFCFLLSTRAGGLGLNLQTADTVIIYDSDWNPHQDLQAQDRAHRIGQKNEVRILRLITSNSVEEKILERAQYKLDMDGKVIQAGKFDNKSTNEERDAMLRVMLESAEAAENLEQDEMDDEDLNMIMARSEEELELFQQMDEDRLRNDQYGPGRKYPRLMDETELPDIYMNEDNPVVEEIEETYGRGARERTRVKYDDGLTEEQWLDAVDNDDDTIENAIKRRDAAIAKRAATREKKIRKENGLGDSPMASRDSSESPAPRKRARKAKETKRKAEEMSVDGDSAAPPPAKRGRARPGKVVETLSNSERATLQTILDNVYDALLDLEEPSKDPDIPPRGIIDPFVELPPKTAYPDYYQLILKPICMDQIKKKINRKEYQSTKAFKNDVLQMCNNCRTYNEDQSLLYQDADLIERTLLAKLKEECDAHPDFTPDNGQNSSTAGDRTSALNSGTGTPMPPVGPARKLKLKMGREPSMAGTDSAMQGDDG